MQLGRVQKAALSSHIGRSLSGWLIAEDRESVRGYPLTTTSALPPREYSVQAFVSVYTTFNRSDGHTIEAHLNSGAQQSPFRSPDNAYSFAVGMMDNYYLLHHTTCSGWGRFEKLEVLMSPRSTAPAAVNASVLSTRDCASQTASMKPNTSVYRGYRFSRETMSHSIWPCHRFSMRISIHLSQVFCAEANASRSPSVVGGVSPAAATVGSW